MIRTWSGNDSKISLHSTTPNFHSIAPLHSTQPFSTCRNNMGLSYFRYSWAQWYPLEIEIHLYSYVQSRLDSNLESQDSTPIWSLQDSTPLHLLADAEIIDILEKVHLEFCKLLLNLKTSTPIYMAKLVDTL